MFPFCRASPVLGMFLWLSLVRDVWLSLFIHIICSLGIEQVKEIFNVLYKTEVRWKQGVWNQDWNS